MSVNHQSILPELTYRLWVWVSCAHQEAGCDDAHHAAKREKYFSCMYRTYAYDAAEEERERYLGCMYFAYASNAAED